MVDLRVADGSGRGTATTKKKIRSVGIVAFLVLASLHPLILLRVISNYNTMRQFNEAHFAQDEDDAGRDRGVNASTKQHTKPMIPRRLIFTYKYNLLKPSKDDPPFDAQDPLTANVLNTIKRYKQYWASADKANGQASVDNEVVISFLDNADCVEVINKVEPKLVEYFTKEKRGDLKADICRIAELLLHGGYYFDADIFVVEPVTLDTLPIQDEELSDPSIQLQYLEKGYEMAQPNEADVVTFATVINVQGVFFQAFLAAMPHHPTIQRAMDYILAYYEGNLEELIPDELLPKLVRYSETIPNRKHPQGIGLGCYTLAAAYLASSHYEWADFASKLQKDIGYPSIVEGSSSKKKKMNYSRFLYEVSLTSKNVTDRELFQDVPLQVNKKRGFGERDWCNFICFGGHKVYFYSRVIGSRGCPNK
jgi:hypothetical protein